MKYCKFISPKGLTQKSMVSLETAIQTMLSQGWDHPNMTFWKVHLASFILIPKLFCYTSAKAIMTSFILVHNQQKSAGSYAILSICFPASSFLLSIHTWWYKYTSLLLQFFCSVFPFHSLYLGFLCTIVFITFLATIRINISMYHFSFGEILLLLSLYAMS